MYRITTWNFRIRFFPPNGLGNNDIDKAKVPQEWIVLEQQLFSFSTAFS